MLQGIFLMQGPGGIIFEYPREMQCIGCYIKPKDFFMKVESCVLSAVGTEQVFAMWQR